VPQLVGCGGDSYPESLRYPLRNDPIINPQDLPRDDKGGGSLTRPDPPGQFPVMSMAQMKQPGNPLSQIKALDPRAVPAGERSALLAGLEQIFGTPARPTVDVPRSADGNPVEGWEDVGTVLSEAHTALKLDAATLQAGSKLYRLHCLHCHGLAGDGRGPTSFWVNPHPRDYRQGTYKFTSTALGGPVRPQHDDLVRTLRSGIEGTAMPAFNLMGEDDLRALASYVIHLSLRGQTEEAVMSLVLNQQLEGDVAQNIKDVTIAFTRQWVRAQARKTPDAKELDEKKLLPVVPYPYKDGDAKQLAESVKRGEGYWKEWQCYVCHQDYGRTALFNYDNWGTLTRPANLTNGMYRGGRRPIDLYWRTYGGVHGVGMPANDNRKGEQIWDIVNYLQVLPYRAMRDQYGIQID
jgi:mono/diheme cytochrome c family protein